MKTLIEKYNVQAPRYTSYPTVPYWNQDVPDQVTWKNAVKRAFSKSKNEGIGLYIHLPFCESLCTYCGCNTRITLNHGVEIPYLETLLKEWELYLALFKTVPRINQIHLGGGTPTFFSAYNLGRFLTGLISTAQLTDDAELSFEAHPANTTRAHLNTLYKIGFRRLSLGIQDFDPQVQYIIHRHQTFEQVKKITELARETGYTSINYDLIYGLPLQTPQTVSATIDKVVQLRPDRIAFYSYAHVPWVKPGQRKFTEADLPAGELKRQLYEMGRETFEKAGYTEIGFDHFALPNDSLFTAAANATLHRNFMGYTTAQNQLLVGLGASSISDAWTMFVQNEKKVEEYRKRVNEGLFPFFKGHALDAEDLVLRKHILNLMCRHYTSWHEPHEQCTHLLTVHEHLKEMEKDDLVRLEPNAVKVTGKGRQFLRNICMAFDARLWEKQPGSRVFSSSV